MRLVGLAIEMLWHRSGKVFDEVMRDLMPASDGNAKPPVNRAVAARLY